MVKRKKFVVTILSFFAAFCLLISGLSFMPAVFAAGETTVYMQDAAVTKYGPSDWQNDPGVEGGMFVPINETWVRYVQFTFSGTSISLVGTKASNTGKFNVYIDGNSVAQGVDTNSETSTQHAVLYTVSDLTEGSHTIKVETSYTAGVGEQYLNFECFRYTAPGDEVEYEMTEEVMLSDERVQLKNDSDWSFGGDGYSNCSFWPGFPRTVTFSFSGNKIELIGKLKPDGGAFDVTIDGEPAGSIDTLREDLEADLADQVLFTTEGLSDGPHTILLSTTTEDTTKWLSLKSFRVYSEKEAEAEVRLKEVDEDSAEIEYSGTWTDGEDAGYIRGGYKSTSADGAKATVVFTPYKGGKAYVALGSASSSARVKVTVDGETVAEKDINGYEIIETEELDVSEHTLVVERVSGGALRLDCVYYQAESIGTLSETKDSVEDEGFTYTGEFISQGGRYFSSSQGASVSYTLSGANIKSISIMSKKHIDSATIKISLNDTVLEEALDLKVPTPVGDNIPVYTINGNALDPNAEYTIKIEVVTADTSLYFEFYGLQIETYKQEADIDLFDYVLPDDISAPAGSELVEKDINAANITLNGFTKESDAFVSTEAGQSIVYTFRGVGFQIRANKADSFGKFEVYIDGANASSAKVNTFAATDGADVVVYHSGELSLGVHTVEIRSIEEYSINSTGSRLEITGFNVFRAEGTDEDNLDPAYDDIPVSDYTLKDNEERSAIAFNDAERVTSDFGTTGTAWVDNTAGRQITLTFRGTGVEVVGDMGPDKGRIAVYVDGALYGNVNTYSATPQTGQVLVRLTDLGNTQHQVRLVILSEHALASTGNYIVVSGFNAICIQNDVDKSQLLNNDHYSVTSYLMGTDYADTYYGGDVLFSNQDGAYIQLQFQGTLLRIHGNKSSDGGVGSVYVDGELYGTFNTRDDAFATQAPLFIVKDLEPNVNHTVRIVIETEYNPVPALAYVSIDYFVVEDYADFAFEGYPEPPADADMGTLEDPELILRPSSDKDFGELAASNAGGCTGTVYYSVGALGAAVVVVSAILLLRRKKKAD